MGEASFRWRPCPGRDVTPDPTVAGLGHPRRGAAAGSVPVSRAERRPTTYIRPVPRSKAQPVLSGSLRGGRAERERPTTPPACEGHDEPFLSTLSRWLSTISCIKSTIDLLTQNEQMLALAAKYQLLASTSCAREAWTAYTFRYVFRPWRSSRLSRDCLRGARENPELVESDHIGSARSWRRARWQPGGDCVQRRDRRSAARVARVAPATPGRVMADRSRRAAR